MTSDALSDLITLIVVGLAIWFFMSVGDPLKPITDWQTENWSPPICVPALDKDC